jgi:RNA polymerase sigma factor (sigma-70 family)
LLFAIYIADLIDTRTAMTKHLKNVLATTIVISEPTDDSQPQREFERLILDLAAGSEQAAWRIAEIYTPHILRVVRSSLPDVVRRRMDSIDFAQIIWASILQRRSYLSAVKSPDHLIALLSTIARRKVTDAFRHNTYQVRDVRRESKLDTGDLEYQAARGGSEKHSIRDRNLTPSQVVGLHEKWTRVVNSLSQRDRTIVRLRIQGCKFPEIAEKVGVCESTAKRVMDRVLEQLKS